MTTTVKNTDSHNSLLSDFRNLADQIKLETKSLHEASGEQQQKYTEIKKALDEFEEKNQEVTKSWLESKKQLSETQERIANLEKALSQSGGDVKGDWKNSLEYKALNKMVKNWDASALSVEERKALRTDVGQDGGYLVPDVLADVIISKVQEISDVRRLSRVMQSDEKSLTIPVTDSIPVAKFEGEMEEIEESQSVFTAETLTAYAQGITTPVTRDLLAFSKFDIENNISNDAAIAFAQSEGKAFLNGTGVKSPEGILVNTKVPRYTTSTSGKVSYDDIILLPKNLKDGYNPYYFLSRATLAYLKTEREGSNNGYIIKQNNGDQPNTINEYPYILLPDMPQITGLTGQTSGNVVLGFGDFFLGYTIIDALGIELIKDQTSKKTQRLIEYTWFKYLAGKVTMPEAFALLTVK